MSTVSGHAAHKRKKCNRQPDEGDEDKQWDDYFKHDCYYCNCVITANLYVINAFIDSSIAIIAITTNI